MQTAHAITLVMKLSKLCNLRCAYCYEWNHLSDRTRMPIELARRVLGAAALEHRARLARRGAHSVVSRLVLHGGEPLILPLAYLEQILRAVRAAFDGLDAEVGVQTNLYHVDASILSFLAEHRVGVGVSFDVLPGARKSLTGGETETIVRRNIELMRRQGIPLGAVTVLGRHNSAGIVQAHDFFARERMGWRVLPLKCGPPERPDEFSISYAEAAKAMSTLYDHWIASGASIRIDPLAEWSETAIRSILGVETRRYDREVDGEIAFLMETNGRVYCDRDAHDDSAWVSDFSNPAVERLIDDDAFARSLARERAAVDSRCSECAVRDACARWPIVSGRAVEGDDPCPVAPLVIGHIRSRLLEWGFSRDALRTLLGELRSGAGAPKAASA